MPSPIRAIRTLSSKLSAAKARRVARRKPTGFSFATADRVSFLNPDDWDHAAKAGGFFMSRSYLDALANHPPSNLSVRCALVYDDGRPVAAVAAQIVEIEGERLVKSQPDAKKGKAAGKKALLKAGLAPLGRRAVSGLKERVLVCGNLLSWGNHGVSFAADADPENVWPAVAEALYRIRRAEKLLGDASLLVIKDLRAGEMAGATPLKTYSYRAVETDPNMVLELDPSWRSYEDYLASLDGKYRKSVRQIIDGATQASVMLETTADLGAHGERLHELYLEVHHAATVRPVTVSPHYLSAVAQAAGDGFRCTIARQNGEIAGFVTSVKDGDTSIGYYIGYDRALAATGVPLYLRLLHCTVAHAIELGCTRLSLGRTALEPKARLGAKPEPLHLWARHRVPAVNWLLRSVLGAVPHDEAPERNPFKK